MTSPSRISTVLFDLDDTLVDSFAARVSALRAAFELAGMDVPAEEYIRRLHGRQLVDAFNELCGNAQTAHRLSHAYRDAYWRKKPGLIKLFPGVEAMVSGLRARQINLGVVTQKERVFLLGERSAGAQQELAELGLGEAIPLTIGFEDVRNHKPHPEAVYLALERLGAVPEETLFIGDSAADMAAAQAGGCWSVHATWGIPLGSPGLNGITPHAVIEAPESLFALGFFGPRTADFAGDSRPPHLAAEALGPTA